jgi:hypothetical protein
MVKREGVESFAHFDDALRDWATEPRFADPMKDVAGTGELNLYTEKRNVKRARTGGPVVSHQDYPTGPRAPMARPTSR